MPLVNLPSTPLRSGFPGSRRRFAAGAILTLAAAANAGQASAQEIEPRLFSDVPVGLHFLALAYGYSHGNILFDPTLPVENAQADVSSGTLRYMTTFPLAGKSARVELVLPHVWGDWKGVVEGQAEDTQRTGLADPRVRLAVNFVGAPAMDLRAFHGHRSRWTAGASLQIILPLGEYDGGDLINLGSNRWTFRPQIGFSRSWAHWEVELSASAWLFTDNQDALGATLEQEPLYAIQTHLSYTFRPGLWMSADVAYADGGRTRVDGEVRNTLNSNSRAGVTLALPLGPRDGLKLAFARGVSTRVGADFDNYLIAWQHMWGGGGR